MHNMLKLKQRYSGILYVTKKYLIYTYTYMYNGASSYETRHHCQ